MAFTIWRITDGKAGHDSQSIGLCNAIERIKTSERFDIVADSTFSNYKNFLLKQFPSGKDLPAPNIIIGVGHGTHLPLLCARHVYGGKAVILMKPSLPLSFFDACIIPEHDGLSSQPNLIRTIGAINPVEFNQNKLPNTGLFLIGGPSKHYSWNDDSIIIQIKEIINANPDIDWTVVDSPRTPKTTLNSIATLPNVDIKNYKETDSTTIRDIIFNTDNIWVSKDSISMIYESLSSGAAVGVLEIEQNKNNKISDSINKLINEKQLTSFDMWESTKNLIHPTIKFNEADRCASLLLERGLLT